VAGFVFKGLTALSNETYQVAWVEGHGYGVVRESHTHYAMIELNSDNPGHGWLVAVDHDDYTIIEEISVGHKEI
jgi:hypothetical protein